MPDDPSYEALLEVAKVHLAIAYGQFTTDTRIPWDRMNGNVPKVREQLWVDALKTTLEHHERIERLIS
jgi:hypothetical protein